MHAGSAFEYGESSVPLDESTVAAPRTSYGRSKLAGTDAVLAAVRRLALPALVARLFTVFGPGERAGGGGGEWDGDVYAECELPRQ